MTHTTDAGHSPSAEAPLPTRAHSYTTCPCIMGPTRHTTAKHSHVGSAVRLCNSHATTEYRATPRTIPRSPSTPSSSAQCSRTSTQKKTFMCLALLSNGLSAHAAADDDVAAEDGVGGHVLVDAERHDGSSHGELDGRGVDHADDVAGAGGLEDAEEGAIAAILGVELDDLLVVV